jgi:hypothetical protein
MPSTGTICAQPGIYTSDCHQIRATIRGGNRFPACRHCNRSALWTFAASAPPPPRTRTRRGQANNAARDPTRGNPGVGS